MYYNFAKPQKEAQPKLLAMSSFSSTATLRRRLATSSLEDSLLNGSWYIFIYIYILLLQQEDWYRKFLDSIAMNYRRIVVPVLVPASIELRAVDCFCKLSRSSPTLTSTRGRR